MKLKPGTRVDRDLLIERVLEQEGEGVVAVAHSAAQQRSVVVKVLPAGAAGARLVSRFARAQSIQSAHAVKYLAIGGLPDGRPYLVLEHLQGMTLKERLRRGPLAVPEALDGFLEACEAVAAGHAAGIAHRSLTTARLFVTETSGRPFVKVLGFINSAQIDVAEDAGANPSVTEYMAPEQITHAIRADRRSDVWALGVILYELLTGKLPFAGMTQKKLMARIIEESPTNPRALRAEISWPVEQAILRSLEKNPTQRWETLADLAAALAPFATERVAGLPARIAEACAPLRKKRPAREARAAAPMADESATRTNASTLAPSRVQEGQEQDDVGFRRILSDGSIEALDPEGVARLTRARRVADAASALAVDARNNPPPRPEEDNVDDDGEDPAVRVIMGPASSPPVSTAGAPPSVIRAARSNERRAARRRRGPSAVHVIALVLAVSLLAGVLAGGAIVLKRRGRPDVDRPPSAVLDERAP